jgi:hypothetical protein
MHSAILLKAEVKALQEANLVKKRRERKRKKRILQGGSLTVQEGVELVRTAGIVQEGVDEAIQAEGSEATQRRCRVCKQVGHNSRTCKQA